LDPAVIDVAAGTSEDAWATWFEQIDLPAGDLLDRRPGTVVVVAPHPDDEVLGVGGTLRLLHDRGWDVRIVAVTDGEASHPGSDVYAATELARIRARESSVAHHALGLGRCTVEQLGVPDGCVAEHEDQLRPRLEVVAGSADLVLAPWGHDGHPDHDACGRAAARAVATCGTELVEYVVWTWNWARPGDERVPWDRARQIELTAAARAGKAAAIQAFGSQIRPIGPATADAAVLPDPVLAYHRRRFEVFLT
jgi:LmbE family N-acetylglucosaminyl deacetylase